MLHFAVLENQIVNIISNENDEIQSIASSIEVPVYNRAELIERYQVGDWLVEMFYAASCKITVYIYIYICHLICFCHFCNPFLTLHVSVYKITTHSLSKLISQGFSN